MASLSITSDVIGGRGNPANILRMEAQAGFTHIHWCHRWTGLYPYTKSETRYVGSLLRKNNLKLLDVHATDGGKEGYAWVSSYKHERKLGLSLIKNRMKFTHRLGGRVIVLHAPIQPQEPSANAAFWAMMADTLKKLTRWAKKYNVRVALEQTDTFPMNLPTLIRMLEMSDPKWIGFCLDTGHGNIHGNNAELITKFASRLFSLHLNDNMGPRQAPGEDPDVHKLPFDGTVDWNEVIHLLRKTSYKGPLSFEVGMSQYEGMSTEEYLRLAYEKAEKLDKMFRR